MAAAEEASVPCSVDPILAYPTGALQEEKQRRSHSAFYRLASQCLLKASVTLQTLHSQGRLLSRNRVTRSSLQSRGEKLGFIF